MEVTNTGFKAYDIRGVYPTEVNEELAYRVGRVFSAILAAETVVVGHDVRLSGPNLVQALSDGLRHGGTKVIDIGQCGTEMVYFATAHYHADGGVMVTASHNPEEYNGMKLVRKDARPISETNGLKEIGAMVVANNFLHAQVVGKKLGELEQVDIMPAYVEHLLSFIDSTTLRPLRIVANPGNGVAGPIVKELAKHLPLEFIYTQAEPDGSFPMGIPNPLLQENREATAKIVRETGADLGLAWDGDCDRCFFFDEQGNSVEGYYMIGLLAQVFLAKHPGEKIIHDPRLMWNTQRMVQEAGGLPICCKSGHSFMKAGLRQQDAIFGGEMSGHYYFKEFTYCDSGMLPWLLLVELLSKQGAKLSQLVAESRELFPISGEINRQVEDGTGILELLAQKYADGEQDRLDGLSVAYPQWRFNVRLSNTEPVLRLNVEARGDRTLLQAKTEELLRFIGGREL